jgi:hypothetical protein
MTRADQISVMGARERWRSLSIAYCDRQKFGSAHIAASVLGEVKVSDAGTPFPTTKNFSVQSIDAANAHRNTQSNIGPLLRDVLEGKYDKYEHEAPHDGQTTDVECLKRPCSREFLKRVYSCTPAPLLSHQQCRRRACIGKTDAASNLPCLVKNNIKHTFTFSFINHYKALWRSG